MTQARVGCSVGVIGLGRARLPRSCRGLETPVVRTRRKYRERLIGGCQRSSLAMDSDGLGGVRDEDVPGTDVLILMFMARVC